MATPPVYCANCEKWVPSGISVGSGSGTMTISKYAYATCPECRNKVPFIEGSYEIIDGLFEIVESQNLTAEELKTLTRIFQQALEHNTPAEQIREIIRREVPNASPIAKFIKDGWNLPFLIGLIAAFIMWQYPIQPSPDKPKKEETAANELNKPQPKKPVNKRKAKTAKNKLKARSKKTNKKIK